jgi:hypothetical protein
MEILYPNTFRKIIFMAENEIIFNLFKDNPKWYRKKFQTML